MIVGCSANGQLYTVDPASGASATIAGGSVPNVDGLPLDAGLLAAVRSALPLAPEIVAWLASHAARRLVPAGFCWPGSSS